ncbi:MAG: hypothetical protein IJ539_02915 [Prevotella sp.]|nr:hypothetical protein [Prevotella sp.]
MKNILAFLLMTACSLSVSAQGHFEFKGFPITGEAKAFVKQMKKLGYGVQYNDKEGFFYALKGNPKKYQYVDVRYTPRSKTVYAVMEANRCYDNTWQGVLRQYRATVNLLAQRYPDAKVTCQERFDNPNIEGSGNEMEALHNKQCHYQTSFIMPEGTVGVEISSIILNVFTGNYLDVNTKTAFIGVIYIDNTNDQLYKKEHTSIY